MAHRAMVKLIHADNFFPKGEANNCRAVVENLGFVDAEYGQEIPNFQLIFPNLEPIFSRIIGEPVVIDNPKSGIFRRPMHFIHFESFETLDEWCFVIALERTTFNVYSHLKDGQYRNFDAYSALDGYQFNYANLFEWDVQTNIVLEANQGLFYRPWMFHSLENGVIQYYKLLGKKEESE